MAVEKTVKLQVDVSDAVTGLKKVRSETDITYAELRRTTPIEIDGSKAQTVLKNLKSETKAVAGSAKEIGSNAENSSKGFNILDTAVKGVGLSFKAMGIGLVVSAFVALQQALSKNQKVMDSVNVVLETISITAQEIINTIVDKGQKVVDFFTKVGSGITKFFKKDLDGLTSSYEENNEQTETAIQRNRRLAKEIVELRNEVKLAEAQQRKLQLTYQKDAEIQRQLRDDTSLTFAERIAANEELGRILNKQFAEEKKLADKKVELAEKELAKNKDNIDLQVALINAQTEVADLEERITGQRSEQLINETALRAENIAAIKDEPIVLKKTAVTKLEITNNTNKEMLAGAKKTQDELTKTESTGAENRIKIERHLNNTRRDIVSSAMGDIGSLLGEESKAAKGLAVGQALINTYSAATAALAPPPVGAGPIFGPIAAVGAVAAGMANVKQILATKLPGADGGGGGGGPEPSVPNPSQGIGPLTPNMEAIQQPTLGGTQPAQAYVIESDISNAQALQEELEIQATL
jgi:hypothetical protein